MVIVDFDRDGLDDMVLDSFESLVLHRSSGDGTFQRSPLGSDTILSGVSAFRVADVDGDNDNDFVVALMATKQIRVLTNDGNGGFPASATITLRQASRVFDATDLDADGDADVVTIAADQVAVHRQSNGAFEPPLILPSINTTDELLTVADVTGDGRPDIIVAGRNTGRLGVFVNTGSGFAAPVVGAFARPMSAIVLADVTEDGNVDAVVSGQSAGQGTISVLPGNGAGAFGAASDFQVDLAGSPEHLATADVDGDGHLDLAVAGAVDTGIDGALLMFGTGAGQFGATKHVTHHRPFKVGFGRFDSNVRPDLVVVSSQVSVFRHTGSPDLYEAREIRTFGPAATFHRGTRLLDVNDDGRADLVGFLDRDTTQTVSWQLADGGNFGPATFELDVGFGFSKWNVADLDNDGRQDLVLYGSGRIRSIRNLGDGTFTTSTQFDLDGRVLFLEIKDITGDGRRDLVVGRSADTIEAIGSVSYLPGVGDGTFGAETVVWSGNSLAGFAVADFTTDGLLDLVVHSHTGVGLQRETYLAIGGGMFAAPTTTSSSDVQATLSTRDINADGKADLIGYLQLDVVANLGNGDGTFGAALHSPMTPVFGHPTHFADFNGDGNLDLANNFAMFSVVLGRGDGTFESTRTFELGPRASGPMGIGDIDMDGRLDAVVHEEQSDRITVLHGQCW